MAREIHFPPHPFEWEGQMYGFRGDPDALHGRWLAALVKQSRTEPVCILKRIAELTERVIDLDYRKAFSAFAQDTGLRTCIARNRTLWRGMARWDPYPAASWERGCWPRGRELEYLGQPVVLAGVSEDGLQLNLEDGRTLPIEQARRAWQTRTLFPVTTLPQDQIRAVLNASMAHDVPYALPIELADTVMLGIPKYYTSFDDATMTWRRVPEERASHVYVEQGFQSARRHVRLDEILSFNVAGQLTLRHPREMRTGPFVERPSHDPVAWARYSAEVARRARQIMADGTSLSDTARQLTSEGVPCRNTFGEEFPCWDRVRLNNILRFY